MCSSKKSKKDKSYQEEQARRAAAVKRGMALIDGQFAGFDDAFYREREKSYMDFATPQIEDEFAAARDQLIFALSRAGLRNSSAGAEEMGKLDKQLLTRRGAAVDAARGVANQARQDVASQKTDLVNQLNSTYDPNAALSGAKSRSAFLRSMPSYEPLSNLFTLPVALASDAITADRLGVGGRGGAALFQSPVRGNAQTVVG
jgi:hypothetical protein